MYVYMYTHAYRQIRVYVYIFIFILMRGALTVARQLIMNSAGGESAWQCNVHSECHRIGSLDSVKLCRKRIKLMCIRGAFAGSLRRGWVIIGIGGVIAMRTAGVFAPRPLGLPPRLSPRGASHSPPYLVQAGLPYQRERSSYLVHAVRSGVAKQNATFTKHEHSFVSKN